jgi:uncharacterized ferritin-like protein (DUF455 family)
MAEKMTPISSPKPALINPKTQRKRHVHAIKSDMEILHDIVSYIQTETNLEGQDTTFRVNGISKATHHPFYTVARWLVVIAEVQKVGGVEVISNREKVIAVKGHYRGGVEPRLE